MTTLADNLERTRWLLQRPDLSPTFTAQLIQQHQEELSKLARRHVFPQIQWIQALASQPLYTLPTTTAKIAYVLYDERTLRYVTEVALDRIQKGWEQAIGEPEYWTTDNQAPNTIRIIPAPSRTGSDIPVIPSPLVMDMHDNFVVFLDEDPALQIVAPDNDLPTMLDFDDVLVFWTAGAMAARESDHQNAPVAQLCEQLAAMWLGLLKG